ncbi:MAG: ribonuclease HII [Candidatus Kerfeldbacteria bacterium]|nr:ribonuclease HII [Candidatus Kerfeldbacteria bacterium]
MTKPTTKEEKALRAQGHAHIAGTDEAGKGAWAGPIVAAAVILPPTISITGVNDSKQLTPKQREKLFVRITKQAVSWSVEVVPNKVIDRIGIQSANVRAIESALKKLHVNPDAVLVDAVKVKHGRKPVKAIIKGDAKVVSIAAASIIAKVVRDALMDGLDREVPGYNFAKHKGYGTADHHAKLKVLGLSPVHRTSFEPMKTMARKPSKKKT